MGCAMVVRHVNSQHAASGAYFYQSLSRYSLWRYLPIFPQLAQWAASRRDLFSLEFCNRLGSLHSTTKPHPLKHTIAVVEHVFQRSFSEVFESFDPTPIGSGAIAQVYRAVIRPHLLPPSFIGQQPLHTTGAEAAKIPLPPVSTAAAEENDPATIPPAVVAVKVLHPNVGDMIRRDLAIMGFFANVLTLIPGVQWLSLDQEVAVFGEMMNEQLDLRHEADNLDQFEKNFKHRRAAVSFPKPLMEYTNHDLLVEEFQYAVPLGAFLRQGGGPYDRAIGTMGLDAFLVRVGTLSPAL
jgi:aarF domain-containing kinase